MSECRRDFLRKAGTAAAGIGCGLPLLGAAWRIFGDTTPEGKQLAMVIDLHKCLDPKIRRDCAEACHREHNVPDIPNPRHEIKWIWDEPYKLVFPDQAHARTTPMLKEKPVLVLCNHCTHPACVKVCPTQATWKRESDGIVMMDMHRCIGCRYCMAACPYGARSFNWLDPRKHLETTRQEFPTRSKGVVEKCNFCAERLRKGKQPVCVEVSRGALVFGDLSDPKSEVSKLLETKHTILRKIAAGTGPNVFYIV